MTTADVAKQLVSLCQKGQFNQAMESLYAPNIVSMEPFDMPNGSPRETRGLDNVRKKAQWWEANHTIHAFTTTGPFVGAEKFAVIFALDVTNKPSGQRRKLEEVAVYTVGNGKIVHEEFLFRAE